MHEIRAITEEFRTIRTHGFKYFKGPNKQNIRCSHRGHSGASWVRFILGMSQGCATRVCASRFRDLSLGELPCDRLVRAERHDGLITSPNQVGNVPCATFEHDVVCIAREAVEIRTMKAGEALQSIQRMGLLERLGIQLDGRMRGVDAGTAALGFLRIPAVRRAVGAKEKFRASTRCRIQQCLAMLFAFQDRQAVMMWAQANRAFRLSSK
jgi:hypothetical protein